MKKAQITIFVIIGLAVMLGIALIFFINRIVSLDSPGFDVPDVSIETRPARILVESCLESSMAEGLRVLGMQGGRLQPPTVRYPAHRSEAVLFEPFIVPYWRHLAECQHPHGCAVSEQPPLCSMDARYCAGLSQGRGSIQEQLETFIEQDILSCLDGFSDLADQYEIQVRSTPSVEVIFSEGYTQAIMDYPLTLVSLTTNNLQEISRFQNHVDVDLLRMYMFADDILEFATSTNYYERQTANLLTIYGGVDEDIPPTDEITFTPGSRIWVQEDVRRILQNDILPFMGLVRYANGANPYFMEPLNELGEYEIYAHGISTTFLPKSSDTIFPFDVRHHYLYEDIFLQIDAGDQVIRPKSLIELDNPILRGLTNFVLQDYRFKYDISYPLIVNIHDPDALAGEGFEFQFALEVAVRNNAPAFINQSVAPYSVVFERGIGDAPVDVTHTFIARNARTNQLLSNVSVSYLCGNEFVLGLTSATVDGPRLHAQMPYCEFGGAIQFSHPDYFAETIFFNNVLDVSPEVFEQELWPLQEKEVIVRKRSVQEILDVIDEATGGLFALESVFSDLEDDEEVLLNIERVQSSPFEREVPLIPFLKIGESSGSSTFSSFGSADIRSIIELSEDMYDDEELEILMESIEQLEEFENNPIDQDSLFFDPSAQQESSDTYTIEVVPGNFSIDATLLSYRPFVLEEVNITPDRPVWQRFLVPYNIVDALVDTSVELPRQEFSTWVTGGIDTSIFLTESMVYNDDPLIIYVLDMPIPADWEEFMEQGDWTMFAELYEEYLQAVVG